MRLPVRLAGCFALMTAVTPLVTLASGQVSTRWPIHSLNRPQPRIVGPAPVDQPGAAPTDAVVLFDSADLSQWVGDSGQAAPLGAGTLNLKCGHVGYYGILGRRQEVYDPTAIPYRWICQLMITLTYEAGKGHAQTNLCIIPVVVRSGAFVAPGGDEFSCAPGWRPVGGPTAR